MHAPSKGIKHRTLFVHVLNLSRRQPESNLIMEDVTNAPTVNFSIGLMLPLRQIIHQGDILGKEIPKAYKGYLRPMLAQGSKMPRCVGDTK